MWRHIKPILQGISLVTTMLVSFLQSVVKENSTKCPWTFLFGSSHNTITTLQPSDKNISTHTGLNL